jgi:hypothetical protein
METPQHISLMRSEYRTVPNMLLILVQERRSTDLFVSQSHALAMATVHRPLTTESRNLLEAESIVSLRE